MSVCPTVSELRFYGCCHPCYHCKFTFSVQEEKLELRRKEMREQKEKREARKRRIEQVLFMFFLSAFIYGKKHIKK